MKEKIVMDSSINHLWVKISKENNEMEKIQRNYNDELLSKRISGILKKYVSDIYTNFAGYYWICRFSEK
jgi:UDP-N-acetylglucosamine 2-epimerase